MPPVIHRYIFRVITQSVICGAQPELPQTRRVGTQTMITHEPTPKGQITDTVTDLSRCLYACRAWFSASAWDFKRASSPMHNTLSWLLPITSYARSVLSVRDQMNAVVLWNLLLHTPVILHKHNLKIVSPMQTHIPHQKHLWEHCVFNPEHPIREKCMYFMSSQA